MPNRIIKESIKFSAQIDELNWFEEVVFYRLMVSADDYGCMDGRMVVLRNALFPTKETVTKKAIEDAIDHLVSVGLLYRYCDAASGMPYLFFPTWEKHQRVRNKHRKYPAPPIDSQESDGRKAFDSNSLSNDGQMTASCQSESNPIQSEHINKELQEDARAREEIRSYQHSEIGTLVSTCLKAMTPKSWEDLRAFLEEMSEDLVAWAVQDACEHGGNTWAYVKKVLCSLQEAGITTVEEAEARNAKHRASKGSSRGGVKPHVNQAMELLKAGAFDDVG